MENKDFERSTEAKTKKIYNTPKIEAIGDVRSATKSGGLNQADLGGQGIPYQPQ